ncbi:MAG TPA: glycoside hydrolase family 88 protein [Opitutaceae bacterium]|nr:glycoside hydrolase family 88 protein [Opitutaceae bacterium]
MNNYWTQNNSAGSINNTWDGAVYMIGDMDAYAATGNSNYLSYAQAWASAHSYSLVNGNTTRDANYQAAGEVYVRLYQLSGTASDLTNITADVKSIVNSSSSKDWTWVDALNMAMPVFAELGQINNSTTYSAKMFSEYNYTKTSLGGPGLYNTTEHLWSRDATFLNTNIYWSRGNAWAFVALAKVLETLPTNDPHYSDYLGTFQAMAAKLITLQQSDGFWYANLLNPSQYPTPETSGTSGFTYGLAWGINAGALSSATYLPAVTKAWNGMVATAVHSNGFLGYVQGQGTQPSSSQPTTYSSTADFGVGLFLEAGNQVAKLASASITPVSAPTFNPGGGSYSSAQTVTISTTTSGASIRYTTDGSTPSETAGTLYSGPVSIGSTATLKALAYESGFTDSAVTSATYTISTGGGTVAAPTFNPGGGTFSSAQTVTISTTTSGASIRYTTDGSAPSETVGTLYSSPVSISTTTTLNAIAYKSGMTDSAVTSATYTIGAVNRSLTGSSGDGFHALALTSAQTGTFTATFDGTPSASPENAVVGLSKGAATGYTGIACIARFNPTGQIDAYNGTAYAAASAINYSAGGTYHFRMVVNVAANTYSVYVTPPGGSELTVGLNYAFRTAVTSLDTWNLDENATPAGCTITANNLTP